jgi:hypothetical protein
VILFLSDYSQGDGEALTCMYKARERRQQAQWYAELAKTAEDVFIKEVLEDLAKELREQADKLEQTEMG